MIEEIAKSIRQAMPNLAELEVQNLANQIFQGLVRSGWALPSYAEDPI